MKGACGTPASVCERRSGRGGQAAARLYRGMLLFLLACPASGDKDPASDSRADSTPVTESATTPATRLLGSHALGEGLAMVHGSDTRAGAGKAAAACDLDGDGVGDLLVGAPENNAGQGLVMCFRGPVSGTLSSADAELLVQGTGTFDGMGTSISCLDDRDGDGGPDVMLGAPKYDEARGAAFLFNGSTLSRAPVLTLEDALGSVRGASPNDQMGIEAGLAGDVDGDGKTEVFVSAWLGDEGAKDSGSLFLYGQVVGVTSPLDALAGWTGIAEKDWAAYGVGAGQDVNADGYDDLLIGADGVDTPSEFAGAAYLLLGPFAGIRSLADADATLLGEYEDENGGHGVAMSPDLTGDGAPDLIIGGFGYQEWAGRVALFSGAPSGSRTFSEADVVVAPAAAGAFYGYSVAGPGDVDGDGIADLFISARYDPTAGENAGAAWLHYGPVDPVTVLESDTAVLLGENAGDEAGFIVMGLDDLNGDGLPELGVGAPGNAAGGELAGALYIWSAAP